MLMGLMKPSIKSGNLTLSPHQNIDYHPRQGKAEAYPGTQPVELSKQRETRYKSEQPRNRNPAKTNWRLERP